MGVSLFRAPHAEGTLVVTCSGAAGIRTPDLRRAKAALSQLSYDPRVSRPASWARLDSNQGPRSYQDRALTT